MKTNTLLLLVTGTLALGASASAGEWPRRFGNAQNTGQAEESTITPENVRRLKYVGLIPTRGQGNDFVNHTPVVGDGLLYFGDWGGIFYAVDLDALDNNGIPKPLIVIDTGTGGLPGGTLGTYTGVQATPSLATIATPTGPEKRLYFGANSLEKTLWCLNVAKIIENRPALRTTPKVCTAAATAVSCLGEYMCGGEGSAAWPISLAAPPSKTFEIGGRRDVLNGSPLVSTNQAIDVDGDGLVEEGEVKDVIFTPSTGLDCSNGEMWAIDAYSGEKYWSWDPVVNGDGLGGVIWTAPAMDVNKNHLFITVGDCVQKPQVGEKAESLVSLFPGTGADPVTGQPQWWHQRRLVDVADLDIGNSPTVVDVPGEDGCNVVVTTDKDGCIYAFPQEADAPEVGDLGFDPLRPGQQRMLWRRCFVPGSLNGGFNASGAVVNGRTVFAQASFLYTDESMPNGGFRVPGDDANAFAVDACNGHVRWASSSIGNGRSEGAIANGMYFQPSLSTNELQIVAADSGEDGKPTLLATVLLPDKGAQGGGGPAIVGDTVFVPLHGHPFIDAANPQTQGIAIVRLQEAGDHSPRIEHGTDTFKGPYLEPVAPGIPGTLLPPVNPDDPYPLM